MIYFVQQGGKESKVDSNTCPTVEPLFLEELPIIALKTQTSFVQ